MKSNIALAELKVIMQAVVLPHNGGTGSQTRRIQSIAGYPSLPDKLGVLPFPYAAHGPLAIHPQLSSAAV